MQVWNHALQFTAEVMLEGLARAGAKSRCTMMGRAAMSLDLQVRSYFHCMSILLSWSVYSPDGSQRQKMLIDCLLACVIDCLIN